MGSDLSLLLGLAWLLPLISFALIVFFGPRMGTAGKGAGYVATGAILGSLLLSVIAMATWLGQHGLRGEAEHLAQVAPDENELARTASSVPIVPVHIGGHGRQAPANEHNDTTLSAVTGIRRIDQQVAESKAEYQGDWYTLAQFGSLQLSIGYYIDALTIVMFVMVTVISTCIHFYSLGYMHEELHEVTDHEVTLPDGHHLTRPGRFHRFFQYLSLFCFSMLGLVISGNLLMTFVFWELVGICSYFLIGFYIERRSACLAANKAFIVNRVGDFGMMIGLMALFGALGTLNFGGEEGIFAQVQRPEASSAHPETAGQLPAKFRAASFRQVSEEHAAAPHVVEAPAGMVLAAARSELAAGAAPTPGNIEQWRTQGKGYWLLVIAGIGIFCGCVGKSAQFPLHVWLPDAMEGPTPVSALVHSATMVAAGVFLVGRFYPVFTPEVLLVVAVIGCITLFLAATIAIVATDIKRVLAYSTLSQLGYMMFALGLGGWLAGMLHLITHAFFKSLLFMCSGSVIHAVHSNEMTVMGGLRKKMPITAYTMLVGCLAISGVGIPGVIGLSGYYSKDAIMAQGINFRQSNPFWGIMFFAFVLGAAITAFYMFRLWFMTFAGEPQDKHRYEHAHESPRVMTWPLIVLAAFAVFVATPPLTSLTDPTTSPLVRLLGQAEPQASGQITAGVLASELTIPAEHASHAPAIHVQATAIATITWVLGIGLAVVVYGQRWVSAAEAAQFFGPIYRFLWHKWWFDELYDRIFVRPVFWISAMIAAFDRRVIDGFLHGCARTAIAISKFDDYFDRLFIDGFVDWLAVRIYSLGLYLRGVQTGKLRQYVVFIVVGTVALFVLASFFVSGA